MVRDKVEYVIFEEELVLWGSKIHATSYDRTTYSREDTTMEYETPKKQKEEWETVVMEEGEHPFPFEFDLPAKSMPSSIDVLRIERICLIIVWQGFNHLYYSLYSPTTADTSRRSEESDSKSERCTYPGRH